MSAPDQWPIGFYAPGSYACKCKICGKQHIADKRAAHCADCTLQATYRSLADLRAAFVRADLCDPMQDARMKRLVDAARKVSDSYWYDSDGVISGIYELEAALRALEQGEG